MKGKLKVATLILLFYLSAAILSPEIANKEAIANWNNKIYWAHNPKLAPPEWVNIVGKKLPPTENLTPSKVEGNVYIYIYEFYYSEAPSDIVVLFQNPGDVEINVTLPSGREFTLYRGLSRSEIRLGMLFTVMGQIAKEKGLNYTDSDLIFGGGLDPIFENAEGVETGLYVLEIKAEEEPTVRVIGKTYGLLGTDSLGRDIWQGFVWGFRETMIMVIAVGSVAVVMGSILGLASAISGTIGTIVDSITKISTVLPLVPTMVMVIPITSKVTYGGHLKVPFWAFVFLLGFLLFGKISRNVRALVETELSKEYIESAVSLGASRWWILKHHVSKTIIPYTLYQFSIVIPKVVAVVSLLGFFEAIPGFNWGTLLGSMITENQLFSMAWWIVLPIGIALAIFAMAFVLINMDMEDKLSFRGQ